MRLIKLGSNIYKFVSVYGSKVGGIEVVASYMVLAAAVDLNEIECALIELERNDHDVAVFGDVAATFIYTAPGTRLTH